MLDLNPAAAKTYGWTREELVGRPIKTLVPPSRHQQADELLRRCRAGQEVKNVEGLRWNKEGQEIPILLTLSLLRDRDGKPDSIASLAIDISALKQAEAELY